MNGLRKKKSGAEIVGALIGSAIGDLIAAYALMCGLNDLHVQAGFLGCFLICVAAHGVIGNGARS